MGQAGKGLDHTNPSSPGSRKPALGTGGHYPPYSAGPGDPGGLGGRPEREHQRQCAPAGVGTLLGPAARLGRWTTVCEFAPTASVKSVFRRAVSTQVGTQEKERAGENLMRGQWSTFVIPRPDRTALSQPQRGAAGPRRSPRPPTLSSEGHSEGRLFSPTRLFPSVLVAMGFRGG